MAVTNPKFELKLENIYLNLHKSAKQKAVNAAEGKNVDLKNSTCEDDKTFGLNKQNEYNFLVSYPMKMRKIMKHEDLNLLSDEKDEEKRKKETEKEIKENEKEIAELKSEALDVSKEYFKWFAGEEVSNKITEDNIQAIPIKIKQKPSEFLKDNRFDVTAMGRAMEAGEKASKEKSEDEDERRKFMEEYADEDIKICFIVPYHLNTTFKED